jgi:hypothetical protein
MVFVDVQVCLLQIYAVLLFSLSTLKSDSVLIEFDHHGRTERAGQYSVLSTLKSDSFLLAFDHHRRTERAGQEVVTMSVSNIEKSTL